MSNPPKNTFDAKVFLAKVGDGKAILELHKNQKIFEQGDAAGTVFYIQTGRVKLTVLSEQGKEAVVAILEPGHSHREADAISIGKLRYRFGGSSGIKHGSKAIRWTADAGKIFLIIIRKPRGAAA